MYQLDEKLMADNRAIVAISKSKTSIEPNLKPGMIAFEHEKKDAYLVASQQQHNRILIEDTSIGKIPYNLNFAGTITIDQDLIVKGNTTNLETQDLIVSDNIIEINYGEKGNGISQGSSGILVDRGKSDDVSWLYSEITDRPNRSGFQNTYADQVLFTIYNDGDVKTLKDFYTKNVFVENSLNTGANLTVEGETLLKKSLVVNQNTHTKGTLTADGATNLKSTLITTGAATLNSTLKVKGTTDIQNTLNVSELATFKKNVIVQGTTELNSTLNVVGAATLNNKLTVQGATQINNNLSATGNLKVDGTTELVLNVTTRNNLTVDKNLSVTGTGKFVGMLNTSNITNSTHISTATLSTSNTASVGTNLTVAGTSTLTGAVTANSTLTTTGATLLKSTLQVPNAITTLKELIVQEATMIKGTLTAMGSTVLESNLAVKSDAGFTGNVIVDKNLSVGGILNVAGKATLTTLETNSTFTANGSSTFNGAVTFKNPITVDAVVSAKEISLDKVRFRGQAGYGTVWTNETNSSLITASKTNDSVTGYGMTLFGEATPAFNMVFSTNANAVGNGFVFAQDKAPIIHIKKSAIRTNADIYALRGGTYSPYLAAADQHKASHSTGGHDFLSPANIGAVKNSRSTSELFTDNEANKPAAAVLGRLFFAKDTKRIWQDLGNTWQIIGGQDTMDWTQITNKPATYTPPIASATVLGGVKIGSNILQDPDGTIHVPKQAIEYVVHLEEFNVPTEQRDFTLSKVFLKGVNHVSPFLFGRRLPPSAFEEISDTTIRFKQPIPAGSHLTFYVMLIPVDLSFIMKLEEYIVNANQTEFVLTQGKYAVGSNKLKVYLNGALIPKSAYVEVSASTIRLLECPGQGSHILIEYIYDPVA